LSWARIFEEQNRAAMRKVRRNTSLDKSTSGERNSVPEAVYAEAARITEVTGYPTL
jgi:hypothetical protein